MPATKNPAAETCPHCRAFNGRSLCGCGTSRALRGEIALSAAEEMAILNAIVLRAPPRNLMDDYTRRRFESQFTAGTIGCWLWRGILNEDGYGRFSIDGCKRQCHRVAYELFVGPIPEGLQIDHLCRNRACVRPDHLEPVTQEENLRRGEGAPAQNARRTHCRHGHELSGDNLKIGPDGHRRCRECLREKSRRYAAKKATT